MLSVGTVVSLVGLQSSSHLNGQEGTVLEGPSEGRVVVRLNEAETSVRVKLGNLHVVPTIGIAEHYEDIHGAAAERGVTESQSGAAG